MAEDMELGGFDDAANGPPLQRQKSQRRSAKSLVAELQSDSSRMSTQSYFWAGLIILVTTSAAHVWIIQGMSDNASIYYVDHEIYSYIFDYLSFSFTMPSRLVGGCVGLGAAFVWLGGLLIAVLMPRPASGAVDSERAERWTLRMFRFVMWMANVSVILSLGPLTGTNDFFQLLMICFTEAACAHSMLNIHRDVKRNGPAAIESQSLIKGQKALPATEGWLTYFIIYVAWMIPHVVLGFNMFVIFDGSHAALSGTDRVAVTALFSTWTVVVVLAKLYVTISVRDGTGWIATTETGSAMQYDEFGQSSSGYAQEIEQAKPKSATTARERRMNDLEAINKTHIGRAIFALWAVTTILLLYSFSVAVAVSAGQSQSSFRGRLQLEWHTGSAKARNGSVIVENYNFVTHSYIVNAFWMMFVAVLALWIVFLGSTFWLVRLQSIIRKAKESRPDLLSYSFTGLAAGLMNAYAIAASGFNDPVTMIAVTALTTSGFAMISRVRSAYVGSSLLWLMSFIICSLPVVVVAESVFMTPWGTSGFSSKWDLVAHGEARKVYAIIHWVLALLETLFTVFTTSPILGALRRDPFIRFWMFFAVQCSVVIRLVFTIGFGQSHVFYA